MTSERTWMDGPEDDDEDETPLRSGAQIVADLEADLAAEDEDDEKADDEDEAVGADADLVLNAADAYANERAAADADSAAFRETVEQNLPGWQPPVEEESDIERAAVAAAAMGPGTPEFQWLMKEMEAANEALRVKMRGGTDGYDAEGEPVIEPFNPNELDSASFQEFMRAVAAGGASADPRHLPAGESYDSWSRKVNSALGKGN